MAMPSDIPIIDLMMGIPSPDPKPGYDFMRPLFRDAESLQILRVPGRVHVQGRPEDGDPGGLHQVHPRADGPLRTSSGP